MTEPLTPEEIETLRERTRVTVDPGARYEAAIDGLLATLDAARPSDETGAWERLRTAAQAVVEHRAGRHGIVHFGCGVEFDVHVADLRATLDAVRPSDEVTGLRERADLTPKERALWENGYDAGRYEAAALAANPAPAGPLDARPSDETGAWERLGDMLTEKHGESCDCDICLYVQPRVDAALANTKEPDGG